MSFVCWFLLIEAYHRLYTLYLVNSSPLHGRTFRIKQLQHDYRDWQQCWSSWDLYKDVVREVLFYFTKTTQKRLPSLCLKWLMPLRLLAFSFLRGIPRAWMNMLTIVTFIILKCFFGENILFLRRRIDCLYWITMKKSGEYVLDELMNKGYTYRRRDKCCAVSWQMLHGHAEQDSV